MDIQQRVDSYIKDRLEQYIAWYDSKSVKMKTKYFQIKTVSAVSAVLIPVITNISLPITIAGRPMDASQAIVTVLGVLVSILIAIEGVYHHREQWVNYRNTEQYLSTQKHLFVNRVEDYSELDEEQAFKLLVSRAEKAIAEENAVTLNVLTRDTGSSGDGREHVGKGQGNSTSS